MLSHVKDSSIGSTSIPVLHGIMACGLYVPKQGLAQLLLGLMLKLCVVLTEFSLCGTCRGNLLYTVYLYTSGGRRMLTVR